jgi:hypothetical protein
LQSAADPPGRRTGAARYVHSAALPPTGEGCRAVLRSEAGPAGFHLAARNMFQPPSDMDGLDAGNKGSRSVGDVMFDKLETV